MNQTIIQRIIRTLSIVIGNNLDFILFFHVARNKRENGLLLKKKKIQGERMELYSPSQTQPPNRPTTIDCYKNFCEIGMWYYALVWLSLHANLNGMTGCKWYEYFLIVFKFDPIWKSFYPSVSDSENIHYPYSDTKSCIFMMSISITILSGKN